MRKEFICVVCGKKAVSVQGGREKKCCSDECRKIYNRKKGGWCGDICEFNEGVSCAFKQCDTCGWNPEVEKIRKGLLT